MVGFKKTISKTFKKSIILKNRVIENLPPKFNPALIHNTS